MNEQDIFLADATVVGAMTSGMITCTMVVIPATQSWPNFISKG